MKSVVLSNQSQYREFIKAGLNPAEFTVYCDNPRFHPALEALGIRLQVLDEIQLKDSWAFINAWGCSRVSHWMKESRAAGIFSQVNLASVARHFFAMTLIPAIKNYHFARSIAAEPGLKELVLFDSLNRRRYPFFSGNAFLNFFLREEAARLSLKTCVFWVHEKENLEYVVPVAPGWASVAGFKKNLKEIFNVGYRWAVRPDKKHPVIVYGSLRHLAPVLLELKKKGKRPALYDFEFHLEQFIFALKNRIPYWLPVCFGRADEESAAPLAGQYLKEFRASLALARRLGIFQYPGYDFMDFIENELFCGLEEYCADLAKRAALYEKILKASEPRAWVLDEDYALRSSFLAGFMKTKGIRLFCVSHANLGVDFSIPESDRIFHHSWTFVHSEFEKDMYAVRGWDPSQFAVTGTPRYDRLLTLSGDRKTKKKGVINLLYTATGLWGFSPDQHGYLGCHFVCYGDFQIPAFKIILEAIEGLPIEMTVKPHSAESVPYWNKFIRGLKSKNKVRVGKSQDDYFKMLVECDAMILSYWSTGLIEAALRDIPTFFVTPNSFESPVLKRFADDGYCTRVSDKAALKQAMETLCRLGPAAFQKGESRKNKEYYLSVRDARSSERLVEFIDSAKGRAS